MAQASARVRSSGIAVAAVANFPLGTARLGEVIDEVGQALADGADEIDVVFPFRAFLAGDQATGATLLAAVSDACRSHSRPAKLKVIL